MYYMATSQVTSVMNWENLEESELAGKGRDALGLGVIGCHWGVHIYVIIQ